MAAEVLESYLLRKNFTNKEKDAQDANITNIAEIKANQIKGSILRINGQDKPLKVDEINIHKVLDRKNTYGKHCTYVVNNHIGYFTNIASIT